MRYILFLVFYRAFSKCTKLIYPVKFGKKFKFFDYDDKKILAAIDFAINNEKVDRNLNNAIIKLLVTSLVLKSRATKSKKS